MDLMLTPCYLIFKVTFQKILLASFIITIGKVIDIITVITWKLLKHP